MLVKLLVSIVFGAIIGWEEGDSDNRVTNCYENGTHEGIVHPAMNFLGSKASSNGSKGVNNWSVHGWQYVNINNAIGISLGSDLSKY